MPESSRAFLGRPRTMHDEIRTGPPYGHALSNLHCREAQTKTILSFQNLEAALPPGMPAGRRSNSRSSVRYMPELATIGSISAANGRPAWRDQGSFFPPWKKRSREVWMQSEPRRPQIILSYIGGHVVKRAPNIAIPSCGPAGPACLPQALASLPFLAPLSPAKPTSLPRH